MWKERRKGAGSSDIFDIIRLKQFIIRPYIPRSARLSGLIEVQGKSRQWVVPKLSGF